LINQNVAARDESKPTSLLHLMLKTMDAPTNDKRFTLYDIHSELKTMLMAGHETAATWINWSLYVFKKYPEVQEKLYTDIVEHTDPDKDEIDFDEIEKMEYMNAFLQEVLRLYPPLGQILRVSRRAEVMEGVEIPPNTHVQIPNFLIQRHPLYWPEPETFKPERWINPTDEEKEMRRSAFMPFGGGPRLCIGQQFATMEVRMTLAYLVRAFRILGAPSQRETECESLISMRAKPDFKVVVKRRITDY
jgi:enediyne biosynthesis protein E7